MLVERLFTVVVVLIIAAGGAQAFAAAAGSHLYLSHQKAKTQLRGGAPVMSMHAENGSADAKKSGLSQRGIVSMTPVRDDLTEFFAAWSDPYHPSENAGGYLVLLVAENKLSWSTLKRRMEDDSKKRGIENWVAGYGDFRGEESFRAALARMMETTFVKAPVDKDCLMVQAGCGAILDSLAWCLAEEGDACITPAPVYPAFSNDFYARARIHLHMAQTHHPHYTLTEEALEKTYTECIEKGRPPKILLICNPCNPTGMIYDDDTLKMCVLWAQKRNLHLISDEIYANSISPGTQFTTQCTCFTSTKYKYWHLRSCCSSRRFFHLGG